MNPRAPGGHPRGRGAGPGAAALSAVAGGCRQGGCLGAGAGVPGRGRVVLQTFYRSRDVDAVGCARWSTLELLRSSGMSSYSLVVFLQ